jgi:hypothetical protein
MSMKSVLKIRLEELTDQDRFNVFPRLNNNYLCAKPLFHEFSKTENVNKVLLLLR